MLRIENAHSDITLNLERYAIFINQIVYTIPLLNVKEENEQNRKSERKFKSIKRCGRLFRHRRTRSRAQWSGALAGCSYNDRSVFISASAPCPRPRPRLRLRPHRSAVLGATNRGVAVVLIK
ncbi:hypothetical protein EVAR_30056_1 [Eumeta japonica]|uniref:Uncharacterized protein n=1 Tax=Eumeta variegata TaxID=151549 RepID=A0A4C1XBU4_EUMVA|nr:hypothetical protein EVAR_30056_1 [Eumeta japonica]